MSRLTRSRRASLMGTPKLASSGRPKRRCSTMFYLWGDDLDPSEITKLFRVQPDDAWRRGDQRTLPNRDGELRPLASVHKRGCWCRSIPGRKRWELEQQLEYWSEFLGARRRALRILQRRSYEAEIDCFMRVPDITLVYLPASLMKSLALLGVTIRLGIYGMEALQKR